MLYIFLKVKVKIEIDNSPPPPPPSPAQPAMGDNSLLLPAESAKDYLRPVFTANK